MKQTIESTASALDKGGRNYSNVLYYSLNAMQVGMVLMNHLREQNMLNSLNSVHL
jgi:hypothetical protein